MSIEGGMIGPCWNPSAEIIHITIWDAGFKDRWWHRLIPRRWRPSCVLASIDLRGRTMQHADGELVVIL